MTVRRWRHSLVGSSLLVVGSIFFFVVSVLAQGEREVPFLSGRVVDLASMIDGPTVDRLEARLAAFEQQTGAQVVVLTVRDLDQEPIEAYAMRVVETWKLGRAEADDGVLLLVAEQERRLRIEVGYGLEGELTDAYSRRILDNVITPRFRQGDFSGGVEAGVDAILAAIEGDAMALAGLDAAGDSVDEGIGPISGCVILLVVLHVFLLLALIGRIVENPTWTSSGGGRWVGGSGGVSSTGGGSSSGGSFSGGGGSFGGGGASGGW